MSGVPEPIRRMPTPELAALALSSPTNIPEQDQSRRHARGEYAERRVVALAEAIVGVRRVRRATGFEDRHQATDVVVTLCDRRMVRLQVKVRAKNKITPAVHRARRHGAVVVRLLPEMPDDVVVRRIREALGLTLKLPAQAWGCDAGRRSPKREWPVQRWEDDGGVVVGSSA
jgi:hypothetical protein